MITIDTNLVARFVLQDIPEHHQRVEDLFRRAAHGEIELFVPTVVFVEMSYLLTRVIRVPRQDAARFLLNFATKDGMTIEHQDTVVDALEFWREHGRISFIDSYILSLSKANGIGQVFSFDRGMNRYPGVELIEP